jgi:hypothetical protein
MGARRRVYDGYLATTDVVVPMIYGVSAAGGGG